MSNLFYNISGTGLYLFSALVNRTCQVQVSGERNFEKALENKGPIIITSWHGMTMMTAAFIRKRLDIRSFIALMPADWRGKSLKVFADHMGAEPYPMNLDGDSSLRMGRKLIQFIRKIKAGKNLILHPDGPEGPAYAVKPGLSYIAQKTGATIIPMGGYCRHSYHVPRWDTYTLPLPFSRVSIHIGKSLLVPKKVRDLTETNQHITNILHRVAAQAKANYYERKP